MAVQFTSQPAYRPQPFIGYNSSKNTLLSDLGDALTAVGNIPATMQQVAMRDQLNKLLMTTLSAPRTQTETIPGQSIPFTSTSGVGAGIDPFAPEGGVNAADLGTLITEPTTKEVPGKEYTEATSRLADVGYTGGGFNFAPKRLSLQEQILLEGEKAKGRGEVAETTQRAMGERQERVEGLKQEGAANRLKTLEEGRTKRATEHENNIRMIATEKNTSDQQKIDKMLKESVRHHQADEANFDKRTNVMRSMITSRADLDKVNALDKWSDDLRQAGAQIVDINGLPNQASPEVNGARSVAIQRYNAIVDQILALDPGAGLSKYTEKDTPVGFGNLLRSFGSAVTGGFIAPPGKQAVPETAPAIPRIAPRTTPRAAPSSSAPTTGTPTLKPSDFPTYDAYLDAVRKKYSGQ